MNTLLISGGYDSMVLKAYLESKGIPLNLMHFDVTVNNLGSKKGENNALFARHFPCTHTGIHFKGSNDDYIACRNSLLLFKAINLIFTQNPNEQHTIYFGFIKNFPYFSDASPEWVEGINKFLEIEFKGKIKVEAPFVNMTKDDIYKLGCSLGVKLEDTFSCNFEDEYGHPCGRCDNCLWRAKHTYPNYERR